MKVPCSFAVSAAVLVLCCRAGAADWPQYRGPNQDGISTEPVKLDWPASGPKVAWKAPTPTGFSSFSVAGGKAFIQVVRNGREICLALDAVTGREL